MDKIRDLDDYDRDGAFLLYQMYLSHMAPKDYITHQNRWMKQHAPKDLIYQMFTFTTDPSKQDLNAQEEYIRSILKRKENLEIFNLAYCKEHEDTNLHFHVFIGAFKSIPPDAFKQYKFKFGSVKKSKMTRNADGIVDYITKDTPRTDLIIDGKIVS